MRNKTQANTQLPTKKRILVIRYRFIGDTILTVPFLRNLKRHYPEAKIDVLVGPQSGEVLKECPYVNELIEFDTTRFHKYDQGKGKTKSFAHYVSLVRQNHYHAVFVLKRSMSSALLAYLSGAKDRIGYGGGLKSIFLTTNVHWDKNKHEVESTLDVLRHANIPVIDNHLEAWTTRDEIITAKALLPEEHKKFVLIHAAAAHPDKMYPASSWSKIITTLSKDHGFTPVFSGAPADILLNQQIIDSSGVECLNLAGKLSIRESMALYKLMQLAICVDSGPSHLSAAVGTPTLAIFGPTDPERWRPFGPQHKAIFDASLSCRPCHYKKTCDDKRQCLTELSPEFVVKEALTLIEVDIN
jgi:heptosyltransferase II